MGSQIRGADTALPPLSGGAGPRPDPPGGGITNIPEKLFFHFLQWLLPAGLERRKNPHYKRAWIFSPIQMPS